MAITLTEKAAKKIQSQLAKSGGGLGLRLGIKKVGCNGFAYTFEYAAEALAGERLTAPVGSRLEDMDFGPVR